MSLIECDNEEVKQENSNKNPIVNSVQRDYMAGEVSKDISRRLLLPKEVVEAHEEGIIHFHDMDYFAQHMHNCCLVNLEDMLQNGTVISETMIEKPHSFSTACNIATQAIAQIASSQYGGQSISLAHLAPFVEVSRQKYRREVREELETAGIETSDEKINEIAEMRVMAEVERGVQMIQYQVITLMTTNGQAPFVTVFMYLDEVPEGRTRDDLAMITEEVLRQRIQGVKNEKGVWITPAFPKLIYVLEEDNITEGSRYYYLTRLAAECTAKRMVPDYISEKIMKELKQDNCYTCMGCRSFLTVYKDENDKFKFYGRFNQGVVTINLVDVACSSGGDEKKFWEIFDERLALCKEALMCRHERLRGTPSDVAPILWQNGALARLKKGEPIDKLLYGGYSTISLGYAGLCECVRYMKGVSHTDPQGTPFALEVMQHMNDMCRKWAEETNIDFSLYGTPLESTTYKFAKSLQKRFGIIPGVTDRNYITNSYHVHVTEEIDAFEKLKFESQFQALSPGGAISYVEVPDMANNLDAVMSVMQFIYDNIMYAELNTKSDYCQACGYNGQIQIIHDKDGKLIWECPNCGNHDQDKMNVARRTCGYIGTQFWNQGRTQEIKERVLHL
jgi:ribonucleoside-triphosphate reductase